jgi:hypothetical protein
MAITNGDIKYSVFHTDLNTVLIFFLNSHTDFKLHTPFVSDVSSLLLEVGKRLSSRSIGGRDSLLLDALLLGDWLPIY